jgi:hypothetical protein
MSFANKPGQTATATDLDIVVMGPDCKNVHGRFLDRANLGGFSFRPLM